MYIIYYCYFHPRQKLKIRKIGLEKAALAQNWSARHKQRIQTLLTTDYMSSESSAEESDGDITTVEKSVLIIKKLPWLRRKYRDAFHQIDTNFYNSHKKSRDKLKQRIQGGNSARLHFHDAPAFAVKPEFRAQDLDLGEELDQELDSSISSEAPSPTPVVP